MARASSFSICVIKKTIDSCWQRAKFSSPPRRPRASAPAPSGSRRHPAILRRPRLACARCNPRLPGPGAARGHRLILFVSGAAGTFSPTFPGSNESVRLRARARARASCEPGRGLVPSPRAAVLRRAALGAACPLDGFPAEPWQMRQPPGAPRAKGSNRAKQKRALGSLPLGSPACLPACHLWRARGARARVRLQNRRRHSADRHLLSRPGCSSPASL